MTMVMGKVLLFIAILTLGIFLLFYDSEWLESKRTAGKGLFPDANYSLVFLKERLGIKRRGG